MHRTTWGVLLTVAALACTCFGQDKPNFSGTWKLNLGRSDFGPSREVFTQTDVIQQNGQTIKVTVAFETEKEKRQYTVTFVTDGNEIEVPKDAREQGATLQTVSASWEGAVLVVHNRLTIQNEVITTVSRYSLSADGKLLTISQYANSTRGKNGYRRTLVFDKAGLPTQSATVLPGGSTSSDPLATAISDPQTRATSARGEQTVRRQSPSTSGPLTNKDVLAMVKAGLSSEVIVAKIKSSTCEFDTSPMELAGLKKAGVSDAVTLVMVQASPDRLAKQPEDTKHTASPPQKASNPSFGAISGRIFLITKGGDLKPARLARMYLFYVTLDYYRGIGEVMPGDKTPGLIYATKSAELGTEDANKAKSGTHVDLCRSELMNADKAALATLDWAQEHKLGAYVPVLDVDEEGQFSTGYNIRPGLYELVARGRAGINDAYWDQNVTVRAGEKTEVKVSSVEASCADEL